MVRDSVEARFCDWCQADRNHDVEATRYDSRHTIEHARCRDCGHVHTNDIHEGDS